MSQKIWEMSLALEPKPWVCLCALFLLSYTCNQCPQKEGDWLAFIHHCGARHEGERSGESLGGPWAICHETCGKPSHKSGHSTRARAWFCLLTAVSWTSRMILGTLKGHQKYLHSERANPSPGPGKASQRSEFLGSLPSILPYRTSRASFKEAFS